MAAATVSSRKLELRFIGLYFWLFWLQCIYHTYLNLYLKRQGFTGTDIGVMGAAVALTGVLVMPFLGVKFDASNKRPAILASLTVLAGVAFVLFSRVPSLGLLVPLAVVLALGWLPLIPLLDTLTFSKTVTGAARHGYGGYRRWGSLGFLVAGVTVGCLAELFDLWVIFPSYLICALLVATLASGIPSQAMPMGDRTIKLSVILDLLRLSNFRRFLLFILFTSLGNGMCWPFRTIYLDSIGVPEWAIGVLWILPILAEIVCFTLARAAISRWGTRPLIMTGLAFGALRWWLLSLVTYSPLLFLTETLHGLSFALYYPAAVTFVQSEVPNRLRGTAQVLYFSCVAGIGSALGAFLGGRMFDEVGMLPVLRIGGTLVMVTGALVMMFVREPAGLRSEK